MQNKLLKYYIGLIVIAVFALGLLVFIVIQASATKHDTQTYKNAQKTADGLNAYIDKKQSIPDSLDDVSITYDSETVSYKKISDEKYKFCVTYEAEGTSVDGTSLISNVVYGDSMDYYDDSSSYETESLYLEEAHKKGEDCQTIKPYLTAGYDSYYDDTMAEPQAGGSDAGYKQMQAEIMKCNDNIALSNDEYDQCLDKAYKLYYKQN